MARNRRSLRKRTTEKARSLAGTVADKVRGTDDQFENVAAAEREQFQDAQAEARREKIRKEALQEARQEALEELQEEFREELREKEKERLRKEEGTRDGILGTVERTVQSAQRGLDRISDEDTDLTDPQALEIADTGQQRRGGGGQSRDRQGSLVDQDLDATFDDR